VESSGTVTLGLTAGSSGTLHLLSGGMLTANRINGGLGTAMLSLKGGTLTAPQINLTLGDTLSGYGDIYGNVSLAAGSILDVYLGETLEIFGTLTLPSEPGSVILNIHTDKEIDSNTPYQLFNASNGIVGNTNAFAFSPSHGFDYVFSGNGLSITVVPEPASLGLLCLGVAALVVRRRK